MSGTVASKTRSYREATARERLAQLLDAGSFSEILGPTERVTSPHLPLLGAPLAFDDGVIIGRARLGGQPVWVAAQEGGFMGGAVGEVHGAKLTGLMACAEPGQPLLLLFESGGVRLHEANAGLIAVSEIMRALLAARQRGVPVLVLIGGANGCFGGTGILACCANRIIMSEEGRLAMSGPEVIETAHGVEEYDARDRARIWRNCGGKQRYLLGDCQVLVPDQIAAFRAAALAQLAQLSQLGQLDQARQSGQIGKSGQRPQSPDNGAADGIGLSLYGQTQEQALLQDRLQRFGGMDDALAIWQALGVPQFDELPMLAADAFVAHVARWRVDPASFTGWPVSAPVPALATAVAETAAGAAGAGVETSTKESWQELAQALFPAGFSITRHGEFLSGTGQVGAQTVAVIGTCEHAEIGVEIALQQAQAVLQVIRQSPGRAILLLVDTVGQRLRQRDERLGINRYMAHLGKCLELARQHGHRVLALVYDQALSGGFLTSGMMADECYALPQAQIRVMALSAMARITKVAEPVLQELAQSNPVFAPGVENYWKMGGIAMIWLNQLDTALMQALAAPATGDTRAKLGHERGARKAAWTIIEQVRHNVAPA